MGSKTCTECGHPGSETARFCEQCGSPLTPSAAPLRAPDPLAAKILSQRAGIEGERKQVTVMFTDIVGSMDLTRSLEEERWGIVLDRFLAIASGAVHGFEGTVNQFTGDGLMAVFGAPVAHEDHARRACLAVLRLQRDVAELAEEVREIDGAEFAIRCGLNSGEVIVGSIGDDLHMDFAPIGNTTALGKRMESLAPVGSTAMSGATAALIEGEFELRELGEFEVKGAGAQRVLELVGPGTAHTRLDAVAATRGLSRFVGRDPERRALEDALDSALRGEGRAVGIVGEPGVGKSRLVREFVAACRSRGLAVNTASAPAHGRFIPFLAALAMYRDYFGIGEHDPPELARQRIETTMRALDDAFEEDLPLLFDFLGVPDLERPLPLLDPDARQRQLLELVDRTTKARSHHEAAVLVVEDLHWMDDASAAFLDAVVEAVSGTRSLLVTTYRPEYEATWASREPHSELALSPLDANAADALLADLLGSDPSLDGLAALIEERTGGNPFFIEEIVQALAESGHLSGSRGDYRLAAELGDLVLPPTVQAVLAARIDRLPAREKALVQTMSVIGKEVPEPLLGEVSDLAEGELADAVLALADAELVTPRVNGSREFVFKHPLTQEVAYGSQLSERRARAHEVVADAIERTYPDALEERAALLAQHWEAAGDELKAAGWHARAAAWAEVTSPADGMRHWRLVRELTRELEASPEIDELATKARIGILGLAWRLGMSPEETAAIHAEGQERGADASVSSPDSKPGLDREKQLPDITRLRGDGTTAAREEAEAERIAAGIEAAPIPPEQATPAEQVLLEINYGATLGMGGCEREALKLWRRAFPQAMGLDDPGLALSTAPGAAFMNWLSGSLREGVEMADRALDLAGDEVGAGSGLAFGCPYALTLAMRGICRRDLGLLDDALDDFERATGLALEHGDPETECYANAQRAILEAFVGEASSALKRASRGLELAEGLSSTITIAQSSAALAAAEVAADRFRDALARSEAALEMIREEAVALYLEPTLLASIARSRLGLGEADAARLAAEEGVKIMEARELAAVALTAPVALAQVLIAIEGAAAAERIEAVLARAMEVARESGARIFEPQIHLELAALARLGGDDGAAAREEAEAQLIAAGFKIPIPAEQAQSEEKLLLDLNYAANLFLAGREQEGHALAKRALHASLDARCSGPALVGAAAVAYSSWSAGSISEGVEAIGPALALAGDDHGAGAGQIFGCPYGAAIAFGALCAGMRGDVERARIDFERAAALAHEHGDVEVESYAHAYRSLVEAEFGEAGAALEGADRALALAEGTNNPVCVLTASAAKAGVLAAAEAFVEALAEGTSALETVRDLGRMRNLEPMLLAAIARSSLALNERGMALPTAEEGVEIMEARDLKAAAIAAPLALAKVLMATEGATAGDRIEAVLSGAMDVARESGARIFEPQIHQTRAELARLQGDEAAAEREEAAADAVAAEITPGRDVDDELTADRLALEVGYTATVYFGRREKEGLELARGINRRARASSDPALVLAGGWPVIYTNWGAGSLDEAVAVGDWILDRAGDDPTVAAGMVVGCPLALARVFRGLCAGYLGDLDKAWSDFDRGIELAHDQGDQEVECYGYHLRSHLETDLGESTAARQDALASLEIAEQVSDQVHMMRGSLAALAAAEIDAGNSGAALERAESGLALIRKSRAGLDLEVMFLAAIAKAKLGVGEIDEARATAEEAVEMMETRELAACAVRAPLGLAEILIASEGNAAADRAESVLARAMAVAHDSGARIFEPQIHQARAELARLRGDAAEANREDAAAERISSEVKSGSPDQRPRSAEELLLDSNYSASLMFGGREREGLELANEVFRQAIGQEDADLAVIASLGAAVANAAAGSTDEALEVIDHALRLAGNDRRVGSGLVFASPYACILSERGLFAGYRGDLERARDDLRDAIRLAREHEDSEVQSYSLARHSILRASVGDIEPARRHAEDALELAESIENTIAACTAGSALAFALAAAGDFAAALERGERTLATVREVGTALHVETVLLVAIAKARMGLGEADAAIAAAEEAVETMEARYLTLFALPAPITLAQMLVATEGVSAADRVESVLTQAMKVARDSGAPIYEPQIEALLTQIAGLRDDESAIAN